MVLDCGVLEVRDPVGTQEVIERPRAQPLVDLSPDDDLERPLYGRERLERGEDAGRCDQDPHQPIPGLGVEARSNDVRNLSDEEADGQCEHEWKNAAGKGSYREKDDEAAFGEREEPEHFETEPKDIDPPAPEQRLIATVDRSPLPADGIEPASVHGLWRRPSSWS